MAMVFMFMGMGAVNAAPDMSKNVIGRSMYLQEWDASLENPLWQNQAIVDIQYMNVDSINLMVPKCLFLRDMAAERLISDLGYTYRYGSTQLDSFITKAHNANITVQLLMFATYTGGTGDAGCKQFFGGSTSEYQPKDRYGNNLLISGKTNYPYLDFNYPEARKLVIDVARYAVTHHDFDGIWWEEPGMYNQNFYSESNLQWSWREGYMEDGYGDPLNIPAGTMTNLQILHMVQQKEKGMTAFFKEWHDNLTALGANYTYPYFWTEAMLYLHKFDRTCMVGSDCAGSGMNITDLANKGYLDRYTTEKSVVY